MTQIEIVDLLKESGVWDEIGYPTCIDKLIDLVVAHEREACARNKTKRITRLKPAALSAPQPSEQGVKSDKGGFRPLF